MIYLDWPATAAETDSTWDSATKSGNWTLTNGDKTAECTFGVPISNIKGTLGRSSGKRYFEIAIVSIGSFGSGVRLDMGVTSTPGTMGTGGSFANNGALDPQGGGAGYRQAGVILINSTNVGTVTALVAGDVVGVAFDIGTGKLWFSRNGAWTQGDPGTSTSEEGTVGSVFSTWYPAACAESGATLKCTLRTVTADFSYSIPSGYVAWGG